jgi:hypothetical protein
MEYDDSDDWVYGAEWIAADLLAMKQRRLADEHTANRWYLVESKDFGRTQRYLLEMLPVEADFYARDEFVLVDYGEGPMGKDFAEAGIRDPLSRHSNSLKNYIYGSYSEAQPITEWINLLGFQREVSEDVTLCMCSHGCNRTAVSNANFCGHCGTHELRMEWSPGSDSCCGCNNIGCCQLSPPSEEPCTEVDGHYWAASSSRCRRLDCRASFCVAYGCNKELMCICTPTRPLRQRE